MDQGSGPALWFLFDSFLLSLKFSVATELKTVSRTVPPVQCDPVQCFRLEEDPGRCSLFPESMGWDPLSSSNNFFTGASDCLNVMSGELEGNWPWAEICLDIEGGGV